MWLLNKSATRVSSRVQIHIKEVRDGILILPKNKFRLLLEVSSINFELKSEDEQDLLIDSFQHFLNSLSSPIQVLIRVREVSVDHYIQEVAKKGLNEKELVYKNQIENYCQFITKLVSGNKILSRKFYIILPYDHQGYFNAEDFLLVKEQLRLHRDVVIRGLEKLGIKARELDSISILDLFYSFYNPTQSKSQELTRQTVKAMLGGGYV